MRRALTLIELLLTMVIVGLVMMVIPKIVFVTNKSFEAIVKEEALYNALALAGVVVSLPWDDANRKYEQILPVEAGSDDYRCDPATGYRIGGFKGSRNCIAETLPMASAKLEREDDEYNDLDDYNGYEVNTSTPYGSKYKIDVAVEYFDDPPLSETIDLSSLSPSAKSTNTKVVKISVSNALSNRKIFFRTTFYYDSVNIGQFYLNKRAWQ